MNRLGHERSPYLLQHADNPVDWFPWGDEAFALARTSDRPLLVSVGYSACHWCHVMEHESFSDPVVAARMNRDFVCLKVDREERPDIDAMCMSAVQTLTGSGGWPTTLFLTPDGRPFWGGTYFPTQPRHGLPSFSQLLEAIAAAWRDKRGECEQAAGDLLERLSSAGERSASTAPDLTMLENAADAIVVRLDRRSGGFGGAPKFPQPTTLDFLLNVGARTGRCEFTEAVELTLRRMAAGGIHDQLGGGFHRYATDAHWQVPHFEKMLYDNALLARSYVRAFGVTCDPHFRRVARDTFAFLLRDMRDPLGGFHSALDADSEGIEGKYYVFSKEEFDALAADDALSGAAFWGVSDGGNWEGTNILHQAMSDTELERRFGVTGDELRSRLRAKLLSVREQRIRPGLDDKIIAGWNGLMLSALAEGATAFGDDELRQAAISLAEFLRQNMIVDGRVARCWRNGEAYGTGMLEDQAALADAFVSLYECTYNPEWLGFAIQIADAMLQYFVSDAGAFTDSPRDGEMLAIRPEEPLDSPMPAGRSLAASALMRLHALTGEGRFSVALEQLLGECAWLIEQMPGSAGAIALVADVSASGMVEVAIAGPVSDRRTRALLDIVEGGWHPGAVRAAGTDERVPLLKGRVGAEPSFHLCRGHECELPVSSPIEAEALWRGSPAWHPPHPVHQLSP